MPDTTSLHESFKSALPAVVFIASIFFFNFLSRVILAPLMPVMEIDLGFTHAGAGHLFLALAVGNALGLLLSGFISRSLYHRKTVGISALLVGTCLLIAPMAETYHSLMGVILLIGVAVGIYLPSGIATITSLVRKEDWGKTMAVHELAPNTSYVVAPILAEVVLLFFDWRIALYLLGAAQIGLGLCFIRFGRGGEFPGIIPGPLMVTQILKRPIFWILVLFFCLSVGASIGSYAMLPLYLVDAHGFLREEANHLLAASRILACLAPFLAGWITDRWGARPTIALALLLTGIALILLGLSSGSMLIAMVLIQPVCSVFMFVPGFTLLSMAFAPEHRSVAVSLMGPFNAVIGVGLVPTFLGHMGDAGHFDIGFIILGCLLLCAMFFLSLLPRGRA